MMICSNCGYENNSDDALSCNLCGKVFRKEVREDKEEQDKQPMSKAKKFYAEMKEEWKKEAKETATDPTGVTGLGHFIWFIITGIWKSKGKERIAWIFFLFTLITAIIIGIILAPMIGLEKALEWKSPPPGFRSESCCLGLVILLIWIFIYWVFFKIFRLPRI